MRYRYIFPTVLLARTLNCHPSITILLHIGYPVCHHVTHSLYQPAAQLLISFDLCPQLLICPTTPTVLHNPVKIKHFLMKNFLKNKIFLEPNRKESHTSSPLYTNYNKHPHTGKGQGKKWWSKSLKNRHRTWHKKRYWASHLSQYDHFWKCLTSHFSLHYLVWNAWPNTYHQWMTTPNTISFTSLFLTQSSYKICHFCGADKYVEAGKTLIRIQFHHLTNLDLTSKQQLCRKQYVVYYCQTSPHFIIHKLNSFPHYPPLKV